jgi:hypothetical protein
MSKSIVRKDLSPTSDNTYYVPSLVLDYIWPNFGYILGADRKCWPSGKQGVPFVYDHPMPPPPLDEKLKAKRL